MGYSITIGELEVTTHPEDALECSGLSFGAEGARRDDAPAYGEPTDFTNARWPSYRAWRDFARHCGINGLLFDLNGNLIGGHPGVRLITQEMLDAVVYARVRLDAAQPAPVATLDADGNYCRLLWLEYWIRWALANCKTPVIANS